MSTTFGVKLSTGEVIPVARRKGNGNCSVSIYYTNDIAHLLPAHIKVIAMDNTPQGIYTIGNIKRAILKQEIKNVEGK